MSNKIPLFKFLLGTVAAGMLVLSHAALNISQTPLFTQSGTVSPNLMLILDDSGSMKAQYLYQYGGTGGGFGMPGPGVVGKSATCPSTPTIDNTCTYNPPAVSVASFTPPAAWDTSVNYSFGDLVTYTDGNIYRCNLDPTCNNTTEPTKSTRRIRPWIIDNTTATSKGAFYELSPDVNRITYDPRVLYKVRLTGANSVATTTPATPSATPFYVFFYKKTDGTSGVWPGTGNDPLLFSSYFDPYSAANALTNSDSALATGATPLPYPQCVGGGVCPASGAGPFPKFLHRTDCADSGCTLAQEQQNYANWKKFHSNRLDLAKTGIGYAFQDITSGLRIGWATINNIGSSDLGSNGSGVSAIDQGTRKQDFYTWLYGRNSNGSTPLREALIAAGKYFSRGDNLGPWANTPTPTSTSLSTQAIGGTDTAAVRAAQASCRRSYTLMTTDGYYNDNAPTFADTDSTAITTITGSTPSGSTLTFSYNGTAKPYYGPSTFTTMADIAMKYWITDLRTDLTNNVPLPIGGGNESFWQNMGFYAVSLGVDGDIDQTTTNLNLLKAGTPVPLNSGGTSPYWPLPPSDGDDPNTVDDMWHATINGRGCMLNARNADALADGVTGMLSEINRIESSQSGVSASAPSLKLDTLGGTYKYTPNYTTGTWVGNVAAAKLDPLSGAELCTKWRVRGDWLVDPADATKHHWYVGGIKDGTPDLPPCTGGPTTFNGITVAGSRGVYAWNGAGYGSFNDTNTFATSATTGVASGKSSAASNALVNYLRGDQSNEDSANDRCTVATIAKFRPRLSVLGDMVNSTPTFVKNSLNMKYDSLPVGTYGQATYGAFQTTKNARTNGVLFAGANDGMVHGFSESTGAELFAFVPRAAMPNMHLLSEKGYDHKYFVDGPTVEADACLTSGSSCSTWNNLLLGTGGAGAQTVYALDVTNPNSMSATSIKWEISPSGVSQGSTFTSSTNFANLGNILTDVQTGLSMSGQWVAIFGNGYNGGSGTNASLFVVNLDTGALIREIVVPTTIPVSGGNNGLGGVTLLRDANQRIIAAYAGDLKGNLWKFDLSSTSAASWALGLSNTPLYKTASAASPANQPITAAPAIVKHPLNGYVIGFGTGKLFESADVNSTTVQSVYGIWDSTTPTAVTQVDKTSLVQQTISSAITGSLVVTNPDLSTTTVSINYYSVSKNPIAWTTVSTTPRGWYIDLPNSGQRTIYPPTSLIGKFFAVDTVSPANAVANACVAAGSGKAWNYVIDMVTGGGPAEAIFTNNGGITPDILVSGYENSADGRTLYLKNDSLSSASGTAFTPLNPGGPGTGTGPNITISCKLTNTCATAVNRTWRQLFMR
jgi:type IV pilus assembly protein PilY1